MKDFTETELANEQWRDIDGYDGMYQVSDLGRVRSRKSGEWKVLKAQKCKCGYLRVNLYRDGKLKHLLVHRLVADAFIPNTDSSKSQINHRNEIKSDNRVSNLEYCTASYNMNYNGLHRRCINKRDNYIRPKLKDLYIPYLSINENIELFKINGIECSKWTVMRLRRDLGIEKYQRKPKQINSINPK